jgi:DNA-binding NtrC family response regulator
MRSYRILVVDDEEETLQVCREILESLEGADVSTETDALHAGGRLAAERFDLVVTDNRVSIANGRTFLLEVRDTDPEIPVIAMASSSSVDAAVESMKLGVVDFVPKPFHPDHFRARVRRVLEELRLRDENRVLERQLDRSYEPCELIGESAAMLRSFETIARASSSRVEVLIVGEPGSGKEHVARRIHHLGERASARFVPVSCSTIPSSQMEREFLGKESVGASAFAPSDIGLVEFAHGGTLFLDEVAEIPIPMQGELARVFGEGKLRRVGGRDEISVDVRVVASTGQDLDRLVDEGRFLGELLDRIGVVRIQLPPLRDREGDVRRLAEHFVRHYATESGRDVIGISEDAIEVLECYPWPGNVRELQNVIRRGLALARGANVEVEDLPERIVNGSFCFPRRRSNGFFRLRDDHVRNFEREYFGRLLARCRGDVARAAAEARVPRGTLYRLLKELGIEPAVYRP